MPLRVDVSLNGAGEGEGVEIQVWETFRGGDWGNKGQAVQVVPLLGGGGKGGLIEGRVVGEKGYFMERSGCEYLPYSARLREMGKKGVAN
jgi:hypothetical protein